jgi:hypothetical protein
MAFVPQVLAIRPGVVEIATAIKLPNGKFLRDAVRLDPANLDGFADALDAWVASRTPEGAFKQGADAMAFVFGGTDWEPRVILVNHGPNGGSLSITLDGASKLAAAARDAARRGVGRS